VFTSKFLTQSQKFPMTRYRTVHVPTYTTTALRKDLRKSELSMHVQVTVNARTSSRNPNYKTLKCYQPQHDRPAACVIAQQYSSATFVSLRFHSGKKKIGVFKILL
jgi:hypothetical protein